MISGGKKREGIRDGRPSSNSRINGEINTNQRYKNYVPIDYIKCELSAEVIGQILNRSFLVFARPIDEETGEIIERFSKNGTPKAPCKKAIFKNMIFMYYPESNRMFLMGSLHKLSNNSEHNHNDFTLNAFNGVLKALNSLFGIIPQHMRILSLEWGLNLSPPISTNMIIDHCLFHRWKRIMAVYDSSEGKYHQVIHKDYYLLKFYNKGLHYGLGFDLFRFERKQLNWSKYCRRYKIGNTLQDLIDTDFRGLSETLLTNWEEVLFFDPFIDSRLDLIMSFRDPLKWKFNNRTTRKKYFDKLRVWNIEHGRNIQGKVRDLMLDKLKELNPNVLTKSYFSYTRKTLTPIQLKLERHCKLTGLDISMQRCDSFLISHTGLRYYQEHIKEEFSRLKNKYLPSRWRSCDEVIQIKEMAHNIRSKWSHIEKKERERYFNECDQLNLFKPTTNKIIIKHYGIDQYERA